MENPELELWNAIDALGPCNPAPRPGRIIEARAGHERVNMAINALIAAVQRGDWPPEARGTTVHRSDQGADVAGDVARMRAIYDRSGTP